MSKQLELAVSVWVDYKPIIIETMLGQANGLLDTLEKWNFKISSTTDPIDWPEYAYDQIFNDGLFEPFKTPNCHAADLYSDYIEEHGNEDDEAIFLTCCWVEALSNGNFPKYRPFIMKLMDIAVNGL